MKKLAIIIFATLIALTLARSAFAAPAGLDDFQTIQKAVKENPQAVPGRTPDTFRVLVTDGRSGKVEVDLTMPLSVIDIVSRCLDGESLRIHDHGCDIDLRALLREIRSLGPTVVIELTGRHEHVKVWLE
jgi:hypothetical protein